MLHRCVVLSDEMLDCLDTILVTKEVFIYWYLKSSQESHIGSAHHCTEALRDKYEAPICNIVQHANYQGRCM